MTMWKVELDNVQTLVEADTREEAIDIAIHSYFGRVRATEADDEDIAWQEQMGGGRPR